MRLTLRTLLAYLDDTLEAGEIKQIGQKVVESDNAQELVARIKQVTRRRRFTTPPDSGPDQAFDANRVAAYLDNDLSAEEVAELEKLCLESDVHLSEAAACHQILTLVLGEPALIPPTARRRMYGLIQGRPVKAVKPAAATKAAEAAPAAAASAADPDDSLMALPLFRNMPWLRWALPLGAVVLLVVLGIILFVQPGGPRDPRAQRSGDGGDPNKDTNKTVSEARKTDPTGGTQKTTETTRLTEVVRKTTEPATTVAVVQQLPPVDKPLPGQQKVGRFVSLKKVVVRETPDGWKRVGIGDEVQTSELLVSLPGYRSDLRLDRKVDLQLWGNLPETQLLPLPLLESAVTLHPTPSSGALDVDFTLRRGRVFFTNKKEKGPAHVRFRFWREEVWDITLDEPDGMVGVELVASYLPDLKPREGEEPLVLVSLYVLRGTASLRVDRRTFGDLKAAPGKAIVEWNNKGRGLEGPYLIEQNIPLWDIEQQPPKDAEQVRLSRQLAAAIDELAGALTVPDKKVAVALMEYAEEKSSREKRMLGIRCLAAIDAVPELLDALAKEDPERFDVRQEALFALKNWLSRGKEQGPRLYDAKSRTGMLLEKNYSNEESETILGLLYGPTSEERKQRELYDVLISYLMHKKLIVRELAIRHLLFLTGDQFKIKYNPGGAPELREEGYRNWKKLLDTNKLPPAPPAPPPMPGKT